MPGVQVDVHATLGAAERAAVLALVEAVTAADGFRPLSDQKWVRLSGAAADAAAELAAAAGEGAGPGGSRGATAPRGAGRGSQPPGQRTPQPGTRTGTGTDTGTGTQPAHPVNGADALALLAWVPARGRAEGPLVAYGQLQRGDATWTVEVVVHPDHRDPDGTIEALLLETALDAVAARDGEALRVWMAAPPPERDAVARRLGFTLERELRQLRTGLPLAAGVRAAGADVAVRPFEPGRDEAAWLQVNNRAFAGHPEQGNWRLTDLAARQREPWFDPAGFLLHEEDGRLAAFCWTKVHRETRPALGEIYVIAVDPDFQGRGLGRSLAVAGLGHLAGAGLTEAMLFVDGANAPALALYAALGFTPARVDRAYVRPVEGRGGAARPAQTPETPTTRPIP